MKKVYLLITTLINMVLIAKGQPESMWQLLENGEIIKWVYIFGDEFNGSELDKSKWKECYDYGCDYNENTYFKKGESHHILDAGTLKLAVKYDPGVYEIWHWDNGVFYTTQEYRPYTAGMLESKQKFKHGLFEISCKLPEGRGLYPSFWLYGGNPNEEFDIFEYKGENPNKLHIDVHCPDGCDNDSETGLVHEGYGGWVTASGNFSDGFHNFMGEWGPNVLIWYLDGRQFEHWFGELEYQAPLIITMAMASNCPAAFCPGPDENTPVPAYFEIDYVRVWSRINCNQEIIIENYSQTNTDPTVLTGGNISLGGNGNSNLENGEYLCLIATEQIELKPGIESDYGSNFSAKIIDCPNVNNSFNSFECNSSDLAILSNNYTEDYSYDVETILYMKIYPNPTDGQLIIEFDGNIDEVYSISLINSAGKIIFEKKRNNRK